MATTMTLAELRLAIRQRADMVNQTGDYTNAFITDGELNSYINQSYFELYDLLVTAYGEDYYVAPFYTFVTDGTTELYDLPDDYYKMRNVSIQSSSVGNPNNSWWTLKPFNMPEVNKYAVPNTQIYFGITNIRYKILGDKLWLNPLAQANQTVRLIYTPLMTTLSSDSDTVQGVSGWTEYIIIDGGIKCLQKEESDVSVLMAQKVEMLKRIEGVSENRDSGMPATVSDTVNSNACFPWGNGGGWGSY